MNSELEGDSIKKQKAALAKAKRPQSIQDSSKGKVILGRLDSTLPKDEAIENATNQVFKMLTDREPPSDD